MPARARHALLLLLFVVVSSTGSAPPARADDYKDALKSIQRSDWPGAFSLLRPLADNGHVGAQFSLGLMYQMGRGVEKDTEKARQYYEAAAEKGFSPAENNLGLIYKLGVGVPVNYGEAIKWFSRAAREHTMAKFNLAEFYDRGIGVPIDDAKALALYLQCAEEGAPACMYRAARFLEAGRGGGKNEKKARVYYYQAAAQGYLLAERKVRIIEERDERAKKAASQKGK